MNARLSRRVVGFSTAAASLVLGLSGLTPLQAFAQFEPMPDPTAMDLTADPCVDFEQYACGQWKAKTQIPGDESSWYRSFSTIDKENELANREILENFAAGKDLELASQSKKLGVFYKSCMDTQAIEAETPRFLQKEMRRIHRLTPRALAKFVGDMHKRGSHVFFGFGSDQDFKDSARMIAVIDQGGLGLPSRDYYFDEDKAKIREAYLKHVEKMLILSGMVPQGAVRAAKNVMAFETELAKNALRPVDRREPENLYHITPVAELSALAPGFNWQDYFHELGAPEFSTLNVAVPAFIQGMGQLVQRTPIRTLKAYLQMRFISSVSRDLGGAFAEERFEFYGKTLSGQAEMTPRWKYCVAESDSSLADALGEAFVAKTFGHEAKAKALGILASIQSAFESNLQGLDWMDSATKQYAIRKLNSFMKKIGYPDSWRNIDSLEITDSHLANVMATSSFATQRDLAKIGKAVDRTEWGMTPSTVNAYYNPPNNEIVFPAGILQSPMFNSSATLSANYGAFGAVIGHEMTHGFDDEGRKFDLDGNLREWWTPGIDTTFTQKAQCLVDQYSQYTVADGVHVDGNLTLGENIADLGGLKMSYLAFVSALPSNLSPEAKLQEEKNFFTAFGQVWCAKSTPEHEKMQVTTDPHSPSKYRVNGTLVNIPEFARAFACASGKPMAPANRCSIW